MIMIRPSQEILLQLLSYVPETGRLLWKPRAIDMFRLGWERQMHSWNCRYAGKEAFTAIDGTGYRSGRIFNKTYHAHRIICVLQSGEWPEEVDHINGDRSDNRWGNLRHVTKRENSKNKRISVLNTSGVTGVYWDKSKGKWFASIQVGGKTKFLGYHATIDLCTSARKSAELQFGFHANHGDHLTRYVSAQYRERELL